LYSVFLLWYGGKSKPLTTIEVDTLKMAVEIAGDLLFSFSS
jgi:hypothetical protein